MGCTASTQRTASASRFKDNYALGKMLGEGSMGQVYAARAIATSPKQQRNSRQGFNLHVPKQQRNSLRSLDDKDYAVKCMSANARTDVSARLGLMELDRVCSKIEMWKEAGKHENCVKLHEVFLNQEGKKHYFVMERCESSVNDRMEEIQSEWTEKQRMDILKQALLGLAHLHGKLIMHRDINPDNMLLDSDKTLKLCGFGSTASFPDPRDGLLKDRCGALEYMSPEMVGELGYAKETDVWSLGVAAYLLAFAALPYPDGYKILQASKPLQFHASNPKEDKTSALMKEFVQMLLKESEYTRPSANKALQSFSHQV